MDDKKLTCYFCHKTVTQETQQGHMASCGQVLVACEYKCGAYVQRSQRAQHEEECGNRTLGRRRNTGVGNVTFQRPQNVNGYMRSDSVMSNKSYANYPPPPPVSNGIADRQLLQNFEKNLNVASSRINALAAKQSEIDSMLGNTLSSQKMQMDALGNHVKVLNDYKAIFQGQIHALQEITKPMEKLCRDNDVTTHNMQEAIKQMTLLNNALGALRVTFKTEQEQSNGLRLTSEKKFEEFKEYCVQENGVLGSMWADQKLETEKLRMRGDEFEQRLNALGDKLDSLSLEIRTASELSAETLEAIKKQNADIEETKKNVAQIKLDVEIAEDTLSNVQGFVSNVPGRIVWKISDFSMRLDVSKKNEKVPIKSPIFYSEDYGYRIRLLVYLNGLKKWKGRFLLACIQVLKGEFDDLLKWPCKLEGNVILRDCENKDMPKDYLRYICAKREDFNDEPEDPHESSAQYIFIPHSTLTKSCFLKNDTLFIELDMNIRRQKNETHI